MRGSAADRAASALHDGQRHLPASRGQTQVVGGALVFAHTVGVLVTGITFHPHVARRRQALDPCAQAVGATLGAGPVAVAFDPQCPGRIAEAGIGRGVFDIGAILGRWRIHPPSGFRRFVEIEKQAEGLLFGLRRPFHVDGLLRRRIDVERDPSRGVRGHRLAIDAHRRTCAGDGHGFGQTGCRRHVRHRKTRRQRRGLLLFDGQCGGLDLLGAGAGRCGRRGCRIGRASAAIGSAGGIAQQVAPGGDHVAERIGVGDIGCSVAGRQGRLEPFRQQILLEEIQRPFFLLALVFFVGERQHFDDDRTGLHQ